MCVVSKPCAATLATLQRCPGLAWGAHAHGRHVSTPLYTARAYILTSDARVPTVSPQLRAAPSSLTLT